MEIYAKLWLKESRMTDFTRRSFTATSITSLTLAGSGTLAKAAAPKPVPFDPLPFVHPELRAGVVPLMQMFGAMTLEKGNLKVIREGAAIFTRPPLPEPVYTKQMIAGRIGDPDVPIYIINAGQRAASRPAILSIHGGGYIRGTALSELSNVQAIAKELDVVIVSVDYRLAPECVFPGPLEDCYAGLKWLYANAASLGVDPNRIAVMGASAGGGLAAILAIAARNRGEVPLIFQALTYPMLDDRTGSIVQKPPQQGAILWTPASNQFGWSSLLGVPAGSRKVPAGSVPAREANLSGLPPTFIGVGSIDLFVDEDIAYAKRLVDAGIQTELVVMPGGFHGFDMFTDAPVVQRYQAHYISALRRGLGL
jgi:acetyl esterase/lipase